VAFILPESSFQIAFACANSPVAALAIIALTFPTASPIYSSSVTVNLKPVYSTLIVFDSTHAAPSIIFVSSAPFSIFALISPKTGANCVANTRHAPVAAKLILSNESLISPAAFDASVLTTKLNLSASAVSSRIAALP